jgi:hypothetical protein
MKGLDCRSAEQENWSVSSWADWLDCELSVQQWWEHLRVDLKASTLGDRLMAWT